MQLSYSYSLFAMNLRVDDQDILQFAEANDLVASEVAANVQPDAELLAAMQTGYGPVGAEFTAAVGEFQQAMLASGTAVAEHFAKHAEDLRAAAGRYVAGDQGSAAAIHGY